MENVLNTLARTGIGSGSITTEVQVGVRNVIIGEDPTDTRELGGTVRFIRGMSDTSSSPSSTDPDDGNWHSVFPADAAKAPFNPVLPYAEQPYTGAGDLVGNPLIMAHPWGQIRRYEIDENWYAGTYESNVSSGPYAYPAPERHRIHELWPRLTSELFVFLQLTADTETVEDNRNPKQPWNDAWGFPLIISYAIYQPPEYTGGDVRKYRDYYLNQALAVYQYNRSLYVSVGAPGPSIAPYDLIDDWEKNYTNLWNHICDVTMPTEDLWWTEESFNVAPWSGIHDLKVPDDIRHAFISAPVEFK
jgi:hypothetical protein